MSRFLKICKVGFDFKSCVHILGKGGKMAIQANETLHKGLKYSEFCYRDVFSGWNGCLSLCRISEYAISFC